MVCYGMAWLSVLALMTMLSIADLVEGTSSASGLSNDDSEDSNRGMYLVRRAKH
jgi:hypothetical protein